MSTARPHRSTDADPAALLPDAGESALAVVIPHLNDAKQLEQCLLALAGQSFDMSRAEIVVVDNGSRELPEDVIARFPGVRMICEATPGPGPARNLGVSVTKAPVLAFIDSDCLPASDWAAAIISRFSRDPGLEVLGGDIQVTVAHPEQPTDAEAFELLYGFRQHLTIHRHRFSATANLATRRNVFEAVGPFGGIDLSEDLDWGQRAAAIGYRTVYAGEVVVRHPARQDMDALYRQWSRHVSHFYIRAKDRPLGRLRWLISIPAMALSPLAEIPNIACSPRLSGFTQRWQAFRALVSVRIFRSGQMIRTMMTSSERKANRLWNRG